MKRIFIIIIFLVNSFCYSQKEKQFNYFFDTCTEQIVNKYDKKFYSKVFYFNNSRDSTYNMSVYKINDSIYSGLNDFKNSILVKFKIDFNYNNVKDLGKIKINKLYNNVAFHKYNTKKYVEDFEYEYDSISNVSIVHITQFKNKKKKKIVNEHYYIFSNNNNIENFEDKNIKNFIIKKYNIDAIKNQNLEKIICLFDGKKIFESKIINIKKINYTLSFSGAETSIKYGPITNFLHNNTTQ